jgi:hypothetical protein
VTILDAYDLPFGCGRVFGHVAPRMSTSPLPLAPAIRSAADEGVPSAYSTVRRSDNILELKRAER